MESNENFVVKYSIGSLMVFEILFGGICALAIYVAVMKKIFDACIIASVLVGVCLFIYWIFKAHWVKIEDGVLKSHTPFAGTKTIKLVDIEKAWIQVGFDRGDSQTGALFKLLFDSKSLVRLMIRPKPDVRMKDFHINIKVLERDNGVRLLNMLPIKDKGKIKASDVSVFSKKGRYN
jgi:hypothetical protein